MAIRNRLYPAPGQETTLREHCRQARYVWNLAVEMQSWRGWQSPSRRSGSGNAARLCNPPGPAERQRQLAEARNAEPWLAEGSSSVQQQALRDFDKSMAAFFDPGNPAKHPRFRSKRGRQGFVVRDTKVRRLNRRWAEVHVPKIGWVRFRWTRQLPGTLGMSRITLDRAGQWHVSFPGLQPAVPRKPARGVAGLDRGVRTALVDSNGQHYRVPRISDRQADRYLGLERKLARQHKGSGKRRKTGQAKAKIAAKVARRRRDWAEKISTRLVAGNDIVVLEKLNIQGMVHKPAPKPDPEQPGAYLPNRAKAKAGLNRGILASCWGLLGQRIEQKANASGATALFVDPRFTSQQCRVCGHTAAGNRESQAVFRCESCGHEDHADANAAKNILARGLLISTGEIVPAHGLGHRSPRKPAKAAVVITRSVA